MLTPMLGLEHQRHPSPQSFKTKQVEAPSEMLTVAGEVVE
jgi:hypothetical protein